MCDDVVIIPSDSTMTEALMALVDFMCGCCSGTHTPVSYNCLTGVCFDPGDGTGIYPTLAACQTVCTDPTQPSWNCVNGVCINPGNGSGQYLSLSACQTACVPPPVTYNCVNGTCVNPGDGTGMYGTLAQCQQFCEDVYESYDCLNGVCTDPGDGSGVYPTLVACNAACTFPPPNISFNCLNGNCTDPGDGSGVYPTLLACNTACTSPTPQVSYNCFLGQCTDPGNGSGVYPTLLACQTACVPVPSVSYNCVSGNCVDPGTGLGLYPTLNACQVVCNPFPPITPCVTTCASSLIQAPLPGNTLVFSAYTITSTSSYTPLTFYPPNSIVLCNSSYTYSGSLWAIWGAGQLVPAGPYVNTIPFTYTLNFSSPINNVFIYLHEYSANVFPLQAESFVFTTDAGFVDITCADYCCATITGGNTVTAMNNPGINCVVDPVYCPAGGNYCNGSGTFIISSSLPYTSLTITGTGGVGGTHIGLCEDQFGSSSTSTIYTTFDALPIPAVSYNCVNCNCVSVAGPSGSYQTLLACQASGCENNKFITTWQTTTPGESIVLPYYLGGTYAGTIDWGDSTTSANSFATSTHIYATPGIYTVTICGTTNGWNFDVTPASAAKIKSVVTWGQLTLGNDIGRYFISCTNLDLSSVTDTLDLFGTGITNMYAMFSRCFSLTTINNINFWDTSAVTNMALMFNNCILFNQSLSFNTSAVTNMSGMFANCSAFNQSLSFNTSLVTDMSIMFFNCASFNSALTFTSTSAVTDMSGMFNSCSAFNSALTFDTSAVINMGAMFANCSVFNQPVNFNTSAVTNMSSMFVYATSFNQPLTFNTSLVTDMSTMFGQCTVFNQPLTFNTSLVTNMNFMFGNSPAFQQDISSWNIQNVTNFTFFMLGKTPATWSTTNFDNLLCGWSLQTVQSGLTIDFGTANYTNAIGGPCYTILDIAPNNWTINSGGGV
jgi:surface protein